MSTYTDLNIFFDKHPVKKDLTVIEDTQAIITAFKNLVLTNHYEIPFQPQIGSNINRLLFENFTYLSKSYIEKEISNIAANFEPRIKLLKVNLYEEQDRNSIQIEMEFKVLISEKVLKTTLKLNRLR